MTEGGNVRNQYFINISSIQMLKFLVIFSLFVGSGSLFANPNLSEVPNGEYTLDKSHASIVWKVSHLGLSPYVARFTDFDMKLILDTHDMSKSRVTAIINAASINTENKKFNQDLISNKWFKTKKFPKITFTSTSYQPNGVDKGKLIGVMQMLGVEKTVEFDVNISGTVADHPFIANSAGIGFTALAVIKRSDWNFRKLIPAVGDQVSIEISAEFSKEKVDQN